MYKLYSCVHVYFFIFIIALLYQTFIFWGHNKVFEFEWFYLNIVYFFPVSHTTDDLVFVWDPEVPLVVDKIELPQLDMVKNVTGDCTQVYSTGKLKF